jgi:MFS transporter, ACS family, D-galactonate transporter
MNVQRLSPALWRLLALLTVSVIVNYIDRGNLSTAASLLKDELGLTTSQLGILLSSFFWAYAAFMVVAGWLADRWDVNGFSRAGSLCGVRRR